MREFNMIVWITQLGLSVALPLAGFSYLGYWLMDRYEMGVWVLICGFALGLICAVEGLLSSLKIMEQQGQKSDTADKPGVSYNDHE